MSVLIRESHRATPHLPTGIGDSKTFFARESEFRVKRLRKDVFCLAKKDVARIRFGTKQQILEDIAHAMDFGTLPPKSKNSFT